MTDQIDRIRDAEEALAYVDATKHGIVNSLEEVHRLLKEMHSRVDDRVTLLLVEQAMLKIEAQLNY